MAPDVRNQSAIRSGRFSPAIIKCTGDWVELSTVPDAVAKSDIPTHAKHFDQSAAIPLLTELSRFVFLLLLLLFHASPLPRSYFPSISYHLVCSPEV